MNSNHYERIMTARSVKLRNIVWKQYGFKNLLVWLLVYLLVGPFLEYVPYAHILLALFMTVVLFSAIYAVNSGGRVLPVAIGMLVLTLIPMWMDRIGWFEVPDAIYPALLAVYLGTLVFSFLRYILSAQHVDADVICASLCTYLVIGLLWGSLFQLLEVVIPGSFGGGLLETACNLHEKADVLNYFSFVTLSTLGYGDISPQTQSAAALCQSEAILGQFFTVVLVARLVALEVSQRGDEKSSNG